MQLRCTNNLACESTLTGPPAILLPQVVRTMDKGPQRPLSPSKSMVMVRSYSNRISLQSSSIHARSAGYTA